MLTTLIVAGTFTPLKKSIESSVDRAFRPTPASGTQPVAPLTGGPQPVAQEPTPVDSLLEDPRLADRIEAIARRVAAEAHMERARSGLQPRPRRASQHREGQVSHRRARHRET